MRPSATNRSSPPNLYLIELSSASLRAIGKMGQLSAVVANCFIYRSANKLHDLLAIALIIACDRSFAKTRPELAPKWHFFLTEPGKIIYFLIFTLALLHTYFNIRSKPQTIGFVSLSLTVLAFCLQQLHKSYNKIKAFLTFKISQTTIALFRIYQIRNRNLALAGSIALLLYSIILPFCFYDTESRGISVIRLFFWSSGVLSYWYMESLLIQMHIIRSELFWLPLLFILYKLSVAFWLLWQTDAAEFDMFPKLKGFAALIAIFFWVLGVLEVVTFKSIQQNNRYDSVAEENEDQIDKRTSTKLANMEQLAQILTVLFAIFWFACVTNHEFGLAYSFLGLTLLILALLLNSDPKTSLFKGGLSNGSRQKNCWKVASKAFFTGHLIFIFIQGSYSDKPAFKDKEITFSFIVSTIGFITSGCYWCSGILRLIAYTKKNMCAADFTNEENARLIFPSYKVRTTPSLNTISRVTKILNIAANCFGAALALMLLIFSSAPSTFSFSSQCAFSWIAMFTALVYTQVFQRVAFPGEAYLTRTLLKGLVNVALGLLFCLTSRFTEAESLSGLSIEQRLIMSMNYVCIILYLIGGTFLIFLHGMKFESDQNVRQVTLPDGSTIFLESQDASQPNLAGSNANRTERSGINRVRASRRVVFASKGTVADKKERKDQKATSKEKLIGDHSVYYRAFAALAKGEQK